VGKQRAGPVARRDVPAFERRESVESYLGGYGLYYRTPLADLGIVAPAGSLLGDRPTQVDVLVPNERAEALAAAFRSSIADTRYYKDYMRGIDPIPADVLDELAERACLCRLPEHPNEQRLLRNVLVEPAERSIGVEQRRLSFAFFLSLLEMEPGIAGPDAVRSDAAFCSSVWRVFEMRKNEKTARSATAAQWAALVGKEYMQDALSLIWIAFCRQGRAAQPPDGFAPVELDRLIREVLVGADAITLPAARVPYEQRTAASAFVAAIDAASHDLSLEELRQWAIETDTAMAGLALLVGLFARMPDAHTLPEEWSQIGGLASNHQPGLLGLRTRLTQHIEGKPSLADTMVWLVHRCILSAHESIAYSKLPDFTFRFRWEHGRLRFYDLDDERFGLADIRRESMAWISKDIGLWERCADVAQLTAVGRQFLAQVFS
jgi:hypothetical protein